MAVVFALLVVGVIAAAVIVGLRDPAAGRMADPVNDALPGSAPPGPLTADDVRRVRFGVVFRGYRMDEVDALLDRVAAQLPPAPSAPPEPPAAAIETGSETAPPAPAAGHDLPAQGAS